MQLDPTMMDQFDAAQKNPQAAVQARASRVPIAMTALLRSSDEKLDWAIKITNLSSSGFAASLPIEAWAGGFPLATIVTLPDFGSRGVRLIRRDGHVAAFQFEKALNQATFARLALKHARNAREDHAAKKAKWNARQTILFSTMLSIWCWVIALSGLNVFL